MTICVNCGEKTVRQDALEGTKNGNNVRRCAVCYTTYFYVGWNEPELEAYLLPEPALVGWNTVPKGTLLILRETQL